MDWVGGCRELSFYYSKDFPLEQALDAIWSCSNLTGPYRERELVGTTEGRVDPSNLAAELQGAVAHLLYGALMLPNGNRSTCLTSAIRYDDGEELVSLCVPDGQLQDIWPETEQSFELLDAVFVEIAKYVLPLAPFARGLIGWELDADEPLRYAGAVPEFRDRGVLDVRGGAVTYYPPWP